MGAGCAMEGSTRGLNVALLEGDDFAAGTSGRSTKLIHGGIRYLEQAVFSADVTKLELVIEALAERAHLLNAAPFMAHPVPIMIPLYKWWELPYMYAGAKAYDIFAWGRRAVPASTLILKVSLSPLGAEPGQLPPCLSASPSAPQPCNQEQGLRSCQAAAVCLAVVTHVRHGGTTAAKMHDSTACLAPCLFLHALCAGRGHVPVPHAQP